MLMTSFFSKNRPAVGGYDGETHSEVCSDGDFLENTYLSEPSIVPDDVKEIMENSVRELAEIPSFRCVVNVGGTANGSLIYRRMAKEEPASDLDIYFIGRSATDDELAHMSTVVANNAQRNPRQQFTMDSMFNGQSREHFLDLNNLDSIIDAGDVNLLALPFQSAFGAVHEAQTAVLKVVMSRADGQQVWDDIVFYHTQSLSLHHGLFSEEFSSSVVSEYYHRKIEKFALKDTPEEMHEHIAQHTKMI